MSEENAHRKPSVKRRVEPSSRSLTIKLLCIWFPVISGKISSTMADMSMRQKMHSVA